MYVFIYAYIYAFIYLKIKIRHLIIPFGNFPPPRAEYKAAAAARAALPSPTSARSVFS